MAWRNHLVTLDPELTTQPAMGSRYKRERNVKLLNGLFTLNGGGAARTYQNAIQEKLSDPLHRDPQALIRASRIQASIAGRSRGNIRPAAPGQVAWKAGYWQAQHKHAAQGPYTMGAMEKQSVWYRISDALGALGSK